MDHYVIGILCLTICIMLKHSNTFKHRMHMGQTDGQPNIQMSAKKPVREIVHVYEINYKMHMIYLQVSASGY